METPTCAYRVDAALVELLDARLGPPLDSYVRGWQVWLEDNGPGGVRLEWRLHPPGGFRMPRGVNPHDLFDVVLQGIAGLGAADGAPGDDVSVDGVSVDRVPDDRAFPAGKEHRRLSEVWEALEVFPAFDDEVPVDELVAAVTSALGGRRPDVAGLIDHGRLGDRWKGAKGNLSVAGVLLDELPPIIG
jgi:hypothetical protein